jgi:hypothetical protein
MPASPEFSPNQEELINQQPAEQPAVAPEKTVVLELAKQQGIDMGKVYELMATMYEKSREFALKEKADLETRLKDMDAARRYGDLTKEIARLDASIAENRARADMLENPAWEQAEAEARRALADNAEWKEAKWTQDKWAEKIDQAKAAALAEENKAWENAEWSAKIDITKLEISPQEVQDYFKELMAALSQAEARLKDAEAQAQRMGIDTENLNKTPIWPGKKKKAYGEYVSALTEVNRLQEELIEEKLFIRDPRAYAERQRASALRAMAITGI